MIPFLDQAYLQVSTFLMIKVPSLKVSWQGNTPDLATASIPDLSKRLVPARRWKREGSTRFFCPQRRE